MGENRLGFGRHQGRQGRVIGWNAGDGRAIPARRDDLGQQQFDARVGSPRRIDHLAQAGNRAGDALVLDEVIGTQVNQHHIGLSGGSPALRVTSPSADPVEDIIDAVTRMAFVVPIEVAAAVGGRGLGAV